MKICVVCNNLGKGGAERVGVNLANGFAQKGHNAIIISDINQEANYPINPKVQILPLFIKKEGKFQKWLKSIKNVRKYARQEKPDVIIGIMEICTFISYLAALGLNIPVIMTEHNSFERPASAPMSFRKKLFKFWINKLYKHITVLTPADKQYIGNRLKNIEVMPNPLFLKPVKVIPSKDKTALAAGRVDDWHYKGFDVLIKSWKKIQDFNDNVNVDDNLRDWWLKIAGAGNTNSLNYLKPLLTDADWVQTEGGWKSEKYHIEFLGFQKDMESLYKKSEIFILSSRYEGFGLVLIEAMSQGCAPIACDFKGRQREILCPEGVSSSKFIRHDSSASSQDSVFEVCENGILCEPDNVDELADAIQKMLIDNDYRKTCQQKAIERSKFYSLDNIISRWEDLLKNIIVKNV